MEKEVNKIGAFFSKWKLRLLLLSVGSLLIVISILMHVLPSMSDPLLSNKVYCFVQQLIATIGGTCLTAGIVDLFLAFSNVHEFIDSVVGKTYHKWTRQLLGQEHIDFSGLSNANLQQLLEYVSKAIIATNSVDQNQCMDSGSLELVSRFLQLITIDSYVINSSIKTIIIPNSKQNYTTIRTITDKEIFSRERTFENRMWYASEINRSTCRCLSLKIDGIDFTDAYQTSKRDLEPDNSRRLSENKYGVSFSVPYPSDKIRHVIEMTMERENHTETIATQFTTLTELSQKCNRVFAIDGPEALNWEIASQAYTTFKYRGSQWSSNYITRRINARTIVYDFNDWVLPGAGFAFAILPAKQEEPDMTRNQHHVYLAPSGGDASDTW